MAQTDTSNRGWTSISVQRETYERVRSLKSGGETYDEVLNRLADYEDNQ